MNSATGTGENWEADSGREEEAAQGGDLGHLGDFGPSLKGTARERGLCLGPWPSVRQTVM